MSRVGNDNNDSTFSPLVLVISTVAFLYGGSLIVRQEGSVPRGDQWETEQGWPPVLYGGMIVTVVGIVLLQKWLKQTGASPNTRKIVIAIGYATVIGWGILRFMNIA